MSPLHMDRFSWFVSTGLRTASLCPRGPRCRLRTTLRPEAGRNGPVRPCSKRGRSFAVYKTLLRAPAIQAARGLPFAGGKRPREVVMAQVTRVLQDSDPAVEAPSSGQLQLVLPPECLTLGGTSVPCFAQPPSPAQPCTVGFPDAQLEGHLPAPSLPSRVPASGLVLSIQPQGLSRSF